MGRQEASKLLKKMNDLKRDFEGTNGKVKVRKDAAQERKDKEMRIEAARKAKEKEEKTFKHYDADGDGMLNGDEIVAYAKGEYDIDLTPEKVEFILNSDAVPKKEKKKVEFKVDDNVVVDGRKGVVSY